MDFKNTKLIEQAMETQVSEVEVMYWIIEDSIYKNKKELAHAVLEMLLYVARYKPNLIQEGLNSSYRKRLKELCYHVFSNQIIQSKQAVEIRPSIDPQKIPFKLESELKNYLAENPDILSQALADPIRIIGTEVETDCEYRCDLVAESKKIFYPIELKIGQGTHAVVSQCSKYCYYFYRKLRYNHYKQIQGVVIGNGYDSWSINELRKEGHWIYTIAPSLDSKTKISLCRIS